MGGLYWPGPLARVGLCLYWPDPQARVGTRCPRLSPSWRRLCPPGRPSGPPTPEGDRPRQLPATGECTNVQTVGIWIQATSRNKCVQNGLSASDNPVARVWTNCTFRRHLATRVYKVYKPSNSILQQERANFTYKRHPAKIVCTNWTSKWDHATFVCKNYTCKRPLHKMYFYATPCNRKVCKTYILWSNLQQADVQTV